jgi:hypothetical protein
MPRAIINNRLRASAWLAALLLSGAISTTFTFSEPPSESAGVALAMMVESA